MNSAIHKNAISFRTGVLALIFLGIGTRSAFSFPLLPFAHQAEFNEGNQNWKESAVIYGISPYFLAQGSKLTPLEATRLRLPELADLGVNTVMLQPIVMAASEGQGYDVTDFFKVSPKLGTEADLLSLIGDAHRLGIRVVLDFPLNHTSVQHPFVKDVANQGEASPYYDFYQHEPIAGVPYSQYFHLRTIGKASFVYYFWEELVNLNFNNPKVRDYTARVLEYWLRTFDADGFRLDAAWGPSTRWRDFYKTLSTALRAIKPDLLLLAEDKAAYPKAYEGSGHPHLKSSGFDLAYDWNSSDPNWLSKWAFQSGDNLSQDVFNASDPSSAAQAFVDAVSANNPEPGSVRPLRYIQNNDTPSFTHTHTLDQAKLAAAAMFLLPGVPLIYYGQETGVDYDQWALPSFDPARSIRSYNPELWLFYQKLIALRRSCSGLTKGTLVNLKKQSNGTVTFSRQSSENKEEISVELHFEDLAGGRPFLVKNCVNSDIFDRQD